MKIEDEVDPPIFLLELWIVELDTRCLEKLDGVRDAGVSEIDIGGIGVSP